MTDQSVPAQPLGNPPRRMTLPDGLRAIAATMVILPHSAGLFAYWAYPSLPTRIMNRVCLLGGLGVQVFFVLSGFVIAATTPRSRMTLGYFVNFMLRRSIRLDPPYWAAIVLSCGYLALRDVLTHDNVQFPSVSMLLANLFYLQDLLGLGSINVVFWTLCIEIQFYLVFCLLLGLFKAMESGGHRPTARSGWSSLVLIAVIFLGSLVWPAGLVGSNWPTPGLFLTHWYAFLIGAIAWWAIGGVVPRWFGGAAIGIILMLGVGLFQTDCLTVAGTAGLLLLANARHALYRWLDIGFVQFLGRLSYSIYLTHVPIIGVVLGLQTRLAPRREVVSYLLLGLVGALTVGIAFVLNRCIELPALRLSRRLKRPPTAVERFGQSQADRNEVKLTHDLAYPDR